MSDLGAQPRKKAPRPATPPEGAAYVTFEQFAAPLQVSAKSLYRVAKHDPTMPVITIGGSKRIHRDRGEKWLRSLEQGPGKPRPVKVTLAIAQREERTA